MKLFYLHHTPLAALLALEQVGRIPRDGWSSYLGNLQREAYRAGIFLYRLGLRWAGNLCLRLWPWRPELTAKSYGCIIGAKFTRRPGEKTDEEKRASRR